MIKKVFTYILLLSTIFISAQAKQEVYMFSYFVGNGEDGLHLAYSYDGLQWDALNDNESFLKPTVGKDKLMRDPFILKGIDGTFHMVWTTGWSDSYIGYASSKDLVTWSDQKMIPVMNHEPDVQNTWAPEMFYDDITGTYYIFWASSILNKHSPVGQLPDVKNPKNHRMYYVTTKDFNSFSETKMFFNPDFSVIDASVIKDGKRFVMFLKNENPNPVEKNIRVTISKKSVLDFPVKVSKPITGDYWAEGPAPLKIGDYFYVYFDKYKERKYGAVRSKDLKKWEDISGQVKFPKGIRHGAAFTVSNELFQKLKEYKKFSALESFKISDVKILDGPFLNAQQVDLKYILALDVDRLLAPYLKNANIKPLKEQYGNWESSGLDGHIGGHYLSALSMMYAATGNKELLDRLNYMLDWLDKCQQKSGNGYVDGIPNGKAFWDDLASGNTQAVRDRWVPLYNIHKLFAGLYDAYHHANSQKAYTILVKLTDWFYGVSQKLTDEQVQEILRSEHGGLNEVFVQVAEMTGEKKYLDLAIKFSDRSILNPLVKQENKLDGKHANTIIPKIIGFKTIADASGKTDWNSASVFFWNTVIDNWTVAIGGNSVREHFHDHKDFSTMVEHNQGPESCNTYNMLKLTKLLYLSDPQTKYMDYYEKAVFNHILSSQHPTKGGFVYFTPMRPRHYRVYSSPQESFWCCVGTGLENHAKYGEMIYAYNNTDLYINLFISSELKWKEKGLTLTQKTKFPYEDFSILNLQTEKPVAINLKIRKPYWANTNELEIYINNKLCNDLKIIDNYIVLSGTWKNGDEIKIKMPKHVSLEYLPDGSSWAAIKYGPIVLAAATDSTNLDGLFANGDRWSHVANGPLYPRSEGPTIISNDKDFSKAVKPVDLSQLTFKMPNLIYPDKYKDLVLRPFYEIHEARYVIYWPIATQQEFDKQREVIAAQEKAMIALEKSTIDQVAPGEQQPEVDHNFQGKGSNTGITLGKHWRDASSWFSYELYDKKKEAKKIQITYFGFDRKKTFNIYLDDILVSSENFKIEKGDKFYTVDYVIPDEIKKANKEKLTIKFEAANNSRTAGIYYVRLLR